MDKAVDTLLTIGFTPIKIIFPEVCEYFPGIFFSVLGSISNKGVLCMRNGRYERYRKQRFTRAQKAILYLLVLPLFSFITGYIITLLFVLPNVLK